MGRLVAITNSLGSTTKYNYDLAGNLISVNNPLGQVQRRKYTITGELARVVEPSGDTAKYEYDAAGRLKVIHHPGKGVSRFTYDAMGNLVNVKNPLDHHVSHYYNKAGRLVNTTDAKGQTTTFSYDHAGRLVQKRLADGKVVRYRYDSIGNLIEANDGTFPVRYTYNDRGRLNQIKYPSIKRVLKYEYDKAGLLSKFIDSEGQVIRYGYDSSNRLSTIKLPGGKEIAFAYNARGNLVSTTYPNGTKGKWEHDVTGRPIGITYTDTNRKTIAGWQYKYNAAGNLIETIKADGRISRYRYDPDNKIIEESSGTGDLVQYSYLPGGNREKLKREGKSIQFRYNQADQLLETDDETFKYDANGNLVERKGPKGVTRYSYDSEDQLVKVLLPDGEEVSFGYAPTGERVWRRDSNGLTHFVTDGVNLLAELDENLKPKATYLHGQGIDNPLMMTRDERSYFYHTDDLGSVARLTDQEGVTAATYDYDAFGILKSQSFVLENPFTYTGRELDTSTALYYYRARYYEPDLGRFYTPDLVPGKIHEPQSLNPYTYVLNNPVNLTDPMGLQPQIITQNGNQYAVFYRGHNMRGIQSIESDLMRTSGRVASYERLIQIVNEINPQTGRPSGLQRAITLHQGTSQGSPLLSLTTDRSIARYWSGGHGEIIELRVPNSELNSRVFSGGPGVEAEWFVEGEVPEHWIVERHPGGATSHTPSRSGGGASQGSASGGSGSSSMSTSSSSGVSASNVAGGVAVLGGTIVTGVNYQACIDEGKTHTECVKEVVVGTVEGTIASGVILAGATYVAGPAAVAAAAPAAPFVAAAAVVAGGYHAGDRWANAPMVKANERDRQQQQANLGKLDETLSRLEAKINTLSPKIDVVNEDIINEIIKQISTIRNNFPPEARPRFNALIRKIRQANTESRADKDEEPNIANAIEAMERVKRNKQEQDSTKPPYVRPNPSESTSESNILDEVSEYQRSRKPVTEKALKKIRAKAARKRTERDTTTVTSVQTGGSTAGTPVQTGGSTAGTGGSSKVYGVFVLTNVSPGGSLWVGEEGKLKNRAIGTFTGGGPCDDLARGCPQVKYQMKAGPFTSLSDAQKAYCRNLIRAWDPPLMTSRKAETSFGIYWIAKAPGCK
ncbi:MAG: RHS repeat-associated core domain-containing protein [Candidatus Scalinduaceae bacterium]